MAVVAGAALAAGIGSAIAAESGLDEPVELAVAGVDEQLVTQLLALESELPAPLPTTAELAADGVDALLTGSFTSARSTFDAVESDLRTLYVTADDAGTPVGDAVASVTFGLLLERQALTVLEETDLSDGTRPLDLSDARDDDGNAIDADGLMGRLHIGLDILFEARGLQRSGYAVLADVPVGVDENSVFAARHQELLAYEDGTEVELREVASSPAEQLLVEVSRFDAPTGVAHSVGVTYVCVDREAYTALADASDVQRVAGAIAWPDEDCREAARAAGLTLVEQVTGDPLLDGVETAVGTG